MHPQPWDLGPFVQQVLQAIEQWSKSPDVVWAHSQTLAFLSAFILLLVAVPLLFMLIQRLRARHEAEELQHLLASVKW